MIPQTKIEQAAKESNNGVAEVMSQFLNAAFEDGVRFAESEMGQAQTFEIDFCGNVKAKIEFKDGELTLISAVDVWGEALDPDQIIITKPNHENES